MRKEEFKRAYDTWYKLEEMVLENKLIQFGRVDDGANVPTIIYKDQPDDDFSFNIEYDTLVGKTFLSSLINFDDKCGGVFQVHIDFFNEYLNEVLDEPSKDKVSVNNAKMEPMTVEKASNIVKAWEYFSVISSFTNDAHEAFKIEKYELCKDGAVELWFWYLNGKVEFSFIDEGQGTKFSDRIYIPKGAYYWPLEDGDPCIGDINMLRNAIKKMSK